MPPTGRVARVWMVGAIWQPLPAILDGMNGTPIAPSGPESFRSRPLPQVAASTRFGLNWQWTAIRLQYERLTSNVISPKDLIEVSMRKHMTGVIDMDFLVIAVRRLLRIADHAKRSGCDVNGTLKPLIRDFESHWGHVIDARNSLEHVDEPRADRALFPSSSSKGDWQFHLPGGNIDVHELFKDAENLAKAISKIIEPYESQPATSQ